MSFILNALRKSEQARQSSQPETLEKKILQKQVIEQKKTPTRLIYLVIVNVFLIACVIMFFKQNDNNEVVGEKAVVATKTEIKDKNKVNESLYQVIKPKIEKIQLSISEQLKTKQISNRQVDNKIVKPQRLQLPKRKVEPVKKVKSVVKPQLLMVSKNLEREERKQNEPPFLSELDYQFRRTVPEIEINVFVYSENEKDRFIMIDMEKYFSGQQIDANMKLKEIRMNGIVVEYNNRVFQIKRKHLQ